MLIIGLRLNSKNLYGCSLTQVHCTVATKGATMDIVLPAAIVGLFLMVLYLVRYKLPDEWDKRESGDDRKK